MKKKAIVLAAGKGVRMQSDLPKVVHLLNGRPMVARVLDVLDELKLDEVVVVVGYKADKVKEACAGHKVVYVEQKEQLGTGHAVKQAKDPIGTDTTVVVLSGDVPLITATTLKQLINDHILKKAAATVMTTILENPFSYGRIIRTADGKLEKIVEQKDANEKEAAVKEINTGTYCFNSKDLFDSLESVSPNNVQKEYYLTDVIGILSRAGKTVNAFIASDPRESIGVNTLDDLNKLEAMLLNAPQH